MSKEFIDLVYNWKSEFASVQDLQARKEQAALKLGIDIPKGEAHERQVQEFLSKQSHYRHTLLISRMELFEEMQRSLKSKAKPQGDAQEDADLKYIKLKGEIDLLCGRLVDDIESGFKTIYGELADKAKEQVKQVRSVEQRLMGKKDTHG